MPARSARMTLPFLPVAAALAAAASAGEPAWTLITPANTGIPGDFVHVLHLDEQDRPWIPAYIPFWEQGGMARMNDDGTWWTISNVDYPVIASPRFNDIIRDADGIMWIASDHGLLRYDPEAGPDSLVRYDEDNTPMPTSEISALDIDPDGAIWLAVSHWEAPFGGLVRFDAAAQTWDVWTTQNGLPWGQQWPGWDWVDFVAAAPDAGGGFTVWFGSREMGMATYKDGAFHWFGNDWPPDDEMTPMGLPSTDPVDELGNVWMILWAGLARRAPDGTFTVVGYPNNWDTEVSRVFAASGGRAVLLTYMGLVELWDGGWTSLGDWGGGHTYAFAEESTGALWVGGIGGAARLGDDAQWQRWRLTNTGMVGYFIEAIDFDDAGRVYMNGNAAPGVGGYDRFDGERWVNANDANYGQGPPWGIPSDNVSSICIRANGNPVIGPTGGHGALEWDGQQYTYVFPQYWDVEHLAEDGLGRMWGADGYGVAYFDDPEEGPKKFIQGQSPIPPGSIGDVVTDREKPGWVWIAAQAGVANTNGDEWIVYSEDDLGVFSVRCMRVADDGTLWVGADNGLVHFDPATGERTMYTKENTPLPSNEIDHVTIAPDGSVWMSTFDSVYPYPGGVTHFDGETWTTYTEESSPLPLEQLWELESRPIDGGYEVWIGTAGEAVAVVTVVTGVTGDLDGDGVVEFSDLLILLASWGACPPPPADCPADLDGDQAVGFADLLILLNNWG